MFDQNKQAATWVSLGEIASDLGVSRARASSLVKEQGFDTLAVNPRAVLVSRADYNLYRQWRRRTQLAAKCGRTNNRLLRSTYYDSKCPICGDYAVLWEHNKACINGHYIPWQGKESEHGSDHPDGHSIPGAGSDR